MIRVIDGADSTLDQMERVPVNPKNRPLEEIKLTHVSSITSSQLRGSSRIPAVVKIALIIDYDTCQSYSGSSEISGSEAD